MIFSFLSREAIYTCQNRAKTKTKTKTKKNLDKEEGVYYS
jgi:hypothetical protein